MTDQDIHESSSSPENDPSAADTRTAHVVEFTGEGKEYFGIWITNILLSIVTFGIYSAWAKVRNKKYFSQNTILDERRFDYHATGKQIFIGRVIVIIGFIVYSVISAIPVLGLLAFIGILFLLPWLLIRSLSFNARMTSFSGIRFGFAAKKWDAFKVFLLYPFLSALTLYTTIPFVIRAQHRFLLNNRTYGTARFSFESAIRPYYKAFGLAIGYSVLMIAIVFPLFGGMAADAIVALGEDDQDVGSFVALMVVYVVLIVAILPATFIYQAFIRQANFAGAALEGGHGFRSTVKPLKLLTIALTNAFLTAITLGIYLPWARCRMHGFLAENSVMLVDGSLDDFVAGEAEQVSAIGDAYSDIEGLDVDLAL